MFPPRLKLSCLFLARYFGVSEGIDVSLEKVTLVGGTQLMAHLRGVCGGDPCPIHNPSDHHMRAWPQVWRWDPPFDLRGIMERTCKHGTGHPDPDDYKIRNGYDPGVHGCDGCCQQPDSVA